MSKSRSYLTTAFQVRTALTGELEVATGEGNVAGATLRSGLPLITAQNVVRQKGVS